MLFITFFKYHVVFQDRSEANIGEDDIIDMIYIILLYFMSLKYVVLYSKDFIENYYENRFLPFSSLRILRLFSATSKELCNNYFLVSKLLF